MSRSLHSVQCDLLHSELSCLLRDRVRVVLACRSCDHNTLARLRRRSESIIGFEGGFCNTHTHTYTIDPPPAPRYCSLSVWRIPHRQRCTHVARFVDSFNQTCYIIYIYKIYYYCRFLFSLSLALYIWLWCACSMLALCWHVSCVRHRPQTSSIQPKRITHTHVVSGSYLCSCDMCNVLANVWSRARARKHAHNISHATTSSDPDVLCFVATRIINFIFHNFRWQ